MVTKENRKSRKTNKNHEKIIFGNRKILMSEHPSTIYFLYDQNKYVKLHVSCCQSIRQQVFHMRSKYVYNGTYTNERNAINTIPNTFH